MPDLTLSDILTILGAVGSLVLLEGLLSGDNALVLAVMVRHLPKEQQRRALRYGIWGAFLFRLIAVVFASLLLKFWQLKVVGGLYLLYLAMSHILSGAHEESEAKERKGAGFWMTVVNVEIADIAFSIDSILAAVAMAEGLPANLQRNDFIRLSIIYIGGVLGIIMMRLVAGVFLILLERFKGLAAGAYFLVAWIGVKLVNSGLYTALNPDPPMVGGWREQIPAWVRAMPEMPDWLFWVGMGVILLLSLLYRPKPRGGEGTALGSADVPASPNGSPHSPEDSPAPAPTEEIT